MNDAQTLLLLRTEYQFYELQVGPSRVADIVARSRLPPVSSKSTAADLLKVNAVVRSKLRSSP